MTSNSTRMPVLFVGHGSPMNAIEDNTWSRGFRDMAKLLPRPRTVLCVSAHWFVPGTFLTGNERPETIHDFGGFPDALFAMQYPAPGDVALANRVVKLLGENRASVRNDWGLDHGTWSVLHHLLPNADVPVVQLSLDRNLAPEQHVELAQSLAPLRDEGVLVLASGNATHNLRFAMRSFATGDTSTPDWATRFDRDVESAFTNHDGVGMAKLAATDDGRMSHPTLDHFLPMVYALGAANVNDKVSFPLSGFDGGSLSMRAALLG